MPTCCPQSCFYQSVTDVYAVLLFYLVVYTEKIFLIKIDYVVTIILKFHRLIVVTAFDFRWSIFDVFNFDRSGRLFAKQRNEEGEEEIRPVKTVKVHRTPGATEDDVTGYARDVTQVREARDEQVRPAYTGPQPRQSVQPRRHSKPDDIQVWIAASSCLCVTENGTVMGNAVIYDTIRYIICTEKLTGKLPV